MRIGIRVKKAYWVVGLEVSSIMKRAIIERDLLGQNNPAIGFAQKC